MSSYIDSYKKSYMQKILLFAVFLLNSVLLFAQSNNPANGTQPEKWCGTTDLSIAKLRELRPTPPKPYKGAGPTLYIPMTLHIVGNDNGSGYYPLRNAYDAFCQLQTDYAPADMVFYLVDTIRYHQNTVYNNHQDFTVGGDMVADYSQPGTLNCFITEVAAGACAYAWYGGAIVLKKSCTTRPNHTWAHEAGHYFSLPHVFVGWEGQSVNAAQPAPAVTNDGTEVELADSSNCTTAGDLFCDTPADYISKRWSCDANHNSQTLIDPTGAPFKASGEYYMSYSSDACMSRFSPQQITAMRDYAQTTLNTITNLTAPPDQPLIPSSLVFRPIVWLRATTRSRFDGTATRTPQNTFWKFRA